MKESDSAEFQRILKGVLDLHNKELSAEAWRIWWNALGNLSLPEVKAALSAHAKSSSFAPKPADIINLCAKDDGRPGPEEAWAMIPKDEDGSVVWTDEMAAAFRIAAPILYEGDAIAARMAFKEAYLREVAKAKDDGIQPRWFPSMGRNYEGREAALMEAAGKGYISYQRAAK